jgi:hypothetical protein
MLQRNSDGTTASILRTPLGRRVKILEQGTGRPVVFLHSGQSEDTCFHSPAP